MAVSVKTSGSQTATLTTEHTLATITDAGVYQLAVDVNAMVGGATPDILELRCYGKARSGDTERLEAVWTLAGAQALKLWRGLPLISPHHLKITLTQTQGSGGRTFPWAVYQT